MCHLVCIALYDVHKSGCVELECFVERNMDLFFQQRHLGWPGMSFLKERLTPSDIEQNIWAGRHPYRPKDCPLCSVKQHVVIGCSNCFPCAVLCPEAVRNFSLGTLSCVMSCLSSEGLKRKGQNGDRLILWPFLCYFKIWIHIFFLFVFKLCPFLYSGWEDLASGAHYADAVHRGTALPVCFA